MADGLYSFRTLTIEVTSLHSFELVAEVEA